MAQVAVIDIIGPVAQFCQNCPTTTLVQAYVDAARKLCHKSKWLRTTIAGSTTAPVLTPYTTGTVTVTNNSAAVVGLGTSWLASVASGDTFTGPSGVVYTVDAVTTNTALALTAVYAGPTLATQAYSIGRSRYYTLYGLGSDTYTEIIGVSAIAISKSATDTYGLDENSTVAWDPDDAASTPELFKYVPEGQFAVHPKPDAAYSLQVGVILQPKRGANSLDANLLTTWDYALQTGALGYLLAIPGQPWSNPTLAARHELIFMDWMNRATSATARMESVDSVPW
jgi:hypothetical protein